MAWASDRIRQRAFALPTVIITSVAMMIVLTAALQALSSIQTSLTNQYYQKIAQEAGESGLARAKSCHSQGYNWTDAKPLTPYTDCSGNRLSGCTDGAGNACNYVLSDATIRSGFSVKAPVKDSDQTYEFNVSASVNQVRKSSGVAVTAANTTTSVGAKVSYRNLPPIKAGNFTTCAISSGDLYCWGKNSNGQVGISTQSSAVREPTLIKGALAGKNVYDVVTGYTTTCAIAGDAATPSVGDGAVYCWGYNNYSQFGNSNFVGTTYLTPRKVVDISSLDNSYALVGISGRSNTCVQMSTTPQNPSSGSAKEYCWGWNDSGQSGDDSGGNTCVSDTGSFTTATCFQDPKSTPSTYIKTAAGSTLGNLESISSVAYRNGCALTVSSARKIWCWGSNSTGQLGRGTSEGYTTRAYPVDGISDPYEIDTNRNGACAISKAGNTQERDVYCWGSNGTNNTDYRTDNIPDFEITSPLSMSRNASGSAAIISSKNDYITQLAMGDESTCFLKSTGKVYCWGYNEEGQLGQPPDGPTYDGSTPTITGSGSSTRPLPPQYAVQVNFPNDIKIRQIAATYNSYCAVSERATTYCWGTNREGELGINSTANNNYQPQKVNVPVKTLVY